METFEQYNDNVMDRSVLIAVVGDNPVLHRKLLNMYAEMAPAINEEIAIAYQTGDTNTLGDLAHKLKSSARSIGANRLANTLQQIETACREANRADVDRNYLPFETQALEVLRCIKDT